LNISAEFVTSAAGEADFPRNGAPEVALVGRSNVGKSSAINGLVRQRIARTSAAPGKTRLANVYRVGRGSALYLIDLPGYGYAGGDRHGLDHVTRAYFGRAGRPSGVHRGRSTPGSGERSAEVGVTIAALLLVDARHPGLESDLGAWRWLQSAVERSAIVATKIDKLARGQRIRALRELESAFDDPVLPISAVTGEGLDDLWKLIDHLANNRNSSRRRSNRLKDLRKATAP